jgi:hypothetical protein
MSLVNVVDGMFVVHLSRLWSADLADPVACSACDLHVKARVSGNWLTVTCPCGTVCHLIYP